MLVSLLVHVFVMLMFAGEIVPATRGRAAPIIHTPLKLAQGLCIAYISAFQLSACYVVTFDHCR